MLAFELLDLEFINRLDDLRLRQFRKLHLRLDFMEDIRLEVFHSRHITTSITLQGTYRGASFLAQLFGQFSTKLSEVRHLSIACGRPSSEIGQNEWMQLFNPFTAVQTLHIDRGRDHLPIENVTRERTTEADSEMLPALDLLYLDCLPREHSLRSLSLLASILAVL